MAILKNKTQADFTQISNTILADKTMSMRERGVLCTLCSLADGWQFSVEGLATLCLDGKDAIRKSIDQLEELGYLTRTKTRDANGKFYTIIEIFTTKQPKQVSPSRPCRHGETSTVKPSPDHRDGLTVTEKPAQYNNINNNIDINNANSINLSIPQTREGEIEKCKSLIARNIDFENLLQSSKTVPGNRAGILHNIYDILCDMVCYPRKAVTILGVEYPWNLVKSRYLKLTSENISSIIDRLANRYYDITNKSAFLISTLFTESQTGAIPSQIKPIHDNQNRFSDQSAPSIKSYNQLKTNQSNRQDKNQYMQRSYTDDEYSLLEKKKLGILQT
ncbi:MAG: helix-turn-helix domain-containing protein [Lachnospiraceae bacterium]|nr:helix-turn-helix domain-containing protein [Lachnospiraceae bacterium]